jgi:gas vesicle protein
MPSKGIVLGFAIGLGIGVIAGLLCAPRPGQETREILKEKSSGFFGKCRSNLKWMLMTKNERYAYLWNRGGSLREWRKYSASRVDQPVMPTTT